MEKDLTRQIVESCVEVARLLNGPGLLESVYEAALCHELGLRGFRTQRQIPIPVTYKNAVVREPFFLDILVENSVILEVKATGKDYPYYQVQLHTHLRLMKVKTGFLVNFGKDPITNGICQILNHSADNS